MGSWSETCAISNISASEGDEVVLIYLKQDPSSKSDREARRGTYSTHFYQPASLPLYGIYNDYGNVAIHDILENKPENLSIQNIINNLDWNLIKNAMISRWNHHYDEDYKNGEKPDEKHWEISSDEMNSNLDHDRFHNAAERGRIFLPGYRKDVVSLTPIIILREVWDYCINNPIFRWPNKEERESLPDGQYNVKCSLEDSINQGIEHIAFLRKLEETREENSRKVREFEEQNPEIEYEDWPEDIKNSELFYFDLDSRHPRNIIFGWLFTSNFEFHRANILLNNFIKRNDICDRDFSRAVCEIVYINNFYENNRKTWHPTTGSGSQNKNYDDTIKYFNKMAEIARKKNEEDLYE